MVIDFIMRFMYDEWYRGQSHTHYISQMVMYMDRSTTASIQAVNYPYANLLKLIMNKINLI